MCWYLKGCKCLISYLLVLRDHASFGYKEFVFVFFVWKQPGIMRHMAQSHLEKHRDRTTTKLHILKK